MGYGLILIIICIIIVYLIINKKEKNIEKADVSYLIEEIESKKRKIFSTLSKVPNKYINYEEKQKIIDEIKDLIKYIKDNEKYLNVNDIKLQLEKCESNIDEIIEELNDNFVKLEKERYAYLLNNIEGKSLDDSQQNTIVTDEKNILVVAGAGSGKTATVVGKIKYLLEKGVKEDEILVISFTNNTVNELKQRLEKQNINIEVKTFHKTGMDYSNIENFGQIQKTVKEFFIKYIMSNDEYFKNCFKFISYYNNYCENLIENEESKCSTVKAKYFDAKIEEERIKKISKIEKTKNNEVVRSREESIIANYLWLHDIDYEYERQYKYIKEKYEPDFTIKNKYGEEIYLEHFGINKEGKCPQYTKDKEDKYLETIEWKRKLHNKNNTKLIETYSYEVFDGVLLDNLKQRLIENNVEIKDKNIKKMTEIEIESIFYEYIDLLASFISCFKDKYPNSKSFYDVKYDIKFDNGYDKKRFEVFLSINNEFFKKYENLFKIVKNIKFKEIDFEDCINLGIENVEKLEDKIKYKYIIIDEFQDISESKLKLIKCIQDKSDANLFCVGDDWQSIYRFAGSNLYYFIDFNKWFNASKIMVLNQTYRFPKETATVATEFILKNSKQILKEIYTPKTIENAINIVYYEDSILYALLNIINEIGVDSQVKLLGRFRRKKCRDLRKLINEENKFYDIFENGKRKIMTYETIHRSKGMEWENVIILDTNALPYEREEDPIKKAVLSIKEEIKNAEERRIFYVALTRAKNKVYLLVNKNNKSDFVEEIISKANVKEYNLLENNKNVCPKCGEGNLTLNFGKKHYFYGCSNYPKCDYKKYIKENEINKIKELFSKFSNIKLDFNYRQEIIENEEAVEEKLKSNDEIVNKLKDFRINQYRLEGIASYMILENKTIDQIAKIKPKNEEELLKIKGIGEKKLEKYGDKILKIVNEK